MKQPILYLLTVCGLLMVACGKTTDPVEEVRHYATHFADKVSAGQLDSVEVSYPEIAQADSVVSIQSDSIVVTETTPGSFDVTFSPNVTLKVSRAEDGSVKVTESYGLFAFPDSKIEIAKKTGMWKKDLTDVQLAEKMRDQDFFEMINDKVKKASSDIISVGKFVLTKTCDFGIDVGKGYHTLTNNTDQPISGSDYEIQMKSENPMTGGQKTTWTDPGKDIPAKGSIRVDISFTMRSFPEIKGVRMKLPENEIIAEFIQFTGNEYQEYLDSKQAK